MALPDKLPASQSYFYMKIITYSYYQITIIDKINPVEKDFRILELLSYITTDILDAIVNSVTTFLKQDNNLKLLEEQYGCDNGPSDNNCGHISANFQEKILENSTLIIDNAIYKESKMFNFYEGKQINVKDTIDFYLLLTFYPSFLLSDQQ